MAFQNVIAPVTKEDAVYLKIKETFPNATQIQSSFLRYEKDVTSNSVNQTFEMTEGNRTKRVKENFVGKNDMHFLYEMKFVVNKYPFVNSDSNNANSVDYPYPDLQIFNEEGEAAALEALWNARLSIKSDSFELLEDLCLDRYRVVPRTQFDPGITQASLSDINSGYQQFSLPYVLSGTSSIKMTYETLAGSDFSAIAGATGFKNNYAIQFKTFVIRNAAQVLNVSNLSDAARKAIKTGKLL